MYNNSLNYNFWNNKKVLITGHTGFKGSWLNLNLQMLNSKVYGISLNPTEKNVLHNQIKTNVKNFYESICNYNEIEKIIKSIEPEIVFHLAAQPLVSESYKNPINTFETNIMGTANIIESCKKIESVKAIIAITTDKVYQNKETGKLFKESDPLGGKDPYSSSKTCAELICECYSKTLINNQFKLVTARAGNVIGGGDWSESRIIPDYVKAWQSNQIMQIRSPKSIRPWQHVIEPNFGYIKLAEYISTENEKIEAVNFGPDLASMINVEDFIQIVQKFNKNGPEILIKKERNEIDESQILMLDNSFAKKLLKWCPIFDIEETIENTILWYKSYYNKDDILKTSLKQLDDYFIKLGV